MPGPSVHARIRSVVTALQRGETEGLVDQVMALQAEIEGSDLPVVDRLGRLQELGRVLVDLGDPGTAAGWFRNVLDYWQDHAPVQGRVRVVVAAGDLALALALAGHEAEAREAAEEARSGLRDLERAAPEQVKRFATGLARVHDQIGPVEIAREMWLTALRHVPTDQPSDGDALLVALGEVERRAGRLAAADTRLTQAQRVVDRSRPLDHPVRASVLAARARLLHALEQPDEAVRRLEAAVNLRRSARRPGAAVEQARDLALLAQWNRQRGDAAAAHRHLDALGTIVAARHGRDSAELTEAVDALGVAAAEAGDLSAAHAAFETARDLAAARHDETARSQAAVRAAWVVHRRARTEETRRALLDAAATSTRPVTAPSSLVVAVIRAQIEAGDAAAGFATATSALAAEGAPTAELRDALVTAAMELAGAGVDVAVPAYEWLLRTGDPSAARRTALHRAAGAREATLGHACEAVDRAAELAGRSRVLEAVVEVQIPGATEAEGLARVLEAELDRGAGTPTAELTAHLLARRLGVGAWLVHLHRFRHVVSGQLRDVAFAVAGSTGAVYLRALGSAEELDGWIAAVCAEGVEAQDAGQRLAGRLIGPLRTLAGLQPGDRLYVVPSTPWMAVPFAALPSPTREGGPWVVHHEVVTLFDVASWAIGSPLDASPGAPRVVGAPRLEPVEGAPVFPDRPGLLASAERAAAILGVTPSTGDEATTAAITAASSARVLVVATHAFAVPDQIEGLVGTGAMASLAADAAVPGLGWLSTAALTRADLAGTEIVDLSGCALPDGLEAPVGCAVARACRQAGARAVVVAFGSVSDAAMVAFGEGFHQALAGGEAPARAVRTAQIDLVEHLAPGAWGAFRCVGDGTAGEPPPLLPAAPLSPSDRAFVEIAVGGILAHTGDPAGALAAYDRAIEDDPRVAEAHLQRGRCLEALARFPDALRAYREAARLEPADGVARYALADLLLRGGQTDSAIEALVALGRQFPGDPAVWRDLVQLHRQAKDWAAARPCAERWLAVARDDDMAWHHYAAILEALDEPQKALVARERTIELRPDHALHWSNLGVHHARRGRFEQAEFNLRKAVELDPGHAASWRNLAQVRLELGRPADAESSARTAVERDPAHPGGHFLLGMTLKALERIEEARPVLKHSADLGHPGAATALASLG